MSSVEVYVVVEGATEQTFIRDVVAPTMSYQGVYLHAALIGKPGHKGGNIRFDRAKTDIGNFLRQRRDTYISTMFDYFRIDPGWPGMDEARQQGTGRATLTAQEKAIVLESATQGALVQACPDLDVRGRFIPYIGMHEFEALLFSDPRVLGEIAEIDPVAIHRILDQHGEPEEIDDDPVWAPSRQLAALNANYRKVAMGKAIAEAIGVPTLRQRCSHFNDWLNRLEALIMRRDVRPEKTSS